MLSKIRGSTRGHTTPRAVWLLLLLAGALFVWPAGSQGVDGQLQVLLESLFSRNDFGGLIAAARLLNDEEVRSASRADPFALFAATGFSATPEEGQGVLVDIRSEGVPVLGQWTPTMSPPGRVKEALALLVVAEGTSDTRFAILLQPQRDIDADAEVLTVENFQARLEAFILIVEGGQDNISRLLEAVRQIADSEEQQDGVFDHSAKSVLFGEFAIELGPDIAAVAINDAGTDRMASAMVFSPDPEGEPLEPGIALGAMNADGTLGAFFIVRPVAE